MSRVTCLPVGKAIKPFDGARVICDRWWIVQDEHLLFFRGFSPQCNAIKEIAERIAKKLYPEADVRFFETVYWEEPP